MRRGPLLFILLLLLALWPQPAAAQTVIGLHFPQTRHFVSDEGGVLFWSEFQRLGGVDAVGYPVSERFEWEGFTVQVFQRAIFQWRPETRSVAFVNVFDRLHDLGKDDAKEAGILPGGSHLEPVGPSVNARTIVIDPGHGGPESGAARESPRLVEKELVLDVALRLARRLRAAGHKVTLTRDSDQQVNQGGDWNRDGKVDVDDDLQTRVLITNSHSPDVFVSLHANGGTPAMRGLSTFYCASCTHAERSRRLATQLHRSVLAAITPFGGTQFGAGVFDEAGLGKPYGHLFVIGPQTPRVAVPNRSAAQALIEMLFVSNAADAALLVRDDVREALAAGLQTGIERYLAGG